ncbi:hypothetical protein BGW36DRAFT_204852 [Talaromyces proteolyticus]|uniref:Zn(2)-C6 fungal-type domain-containing protein n=1 Tax=Talaromyces proteolyticus TaxID=1131652 RepID=A0AAD4PYV3_9EURO|nr:uncharacterized protein BGW36DRAFT_204852 [Talaromyces proteolyticus]KAH8695578.1 hypothetical protein BGW36DRAFT_204852 [Talaromyces proteolyticus]
MASSIWPIEIAPIRVKHYQLACSFCKTRKIKCDRQRPSCSSCIKHDRANTCSFRSPHQGLLQNCDYVKYLEQRIRSLEEAQNGDLLEKEQEDTAHDELIDELSAVDVLTWESPAPLMQLPGIVLCSADITGTLQPAAGAVEELPKPSLPDKHIGAKLIQCYLDHIHASTIPFISARTLWSQFDLVYAAEFDMTNANHALYGPWFNVFIAMAIATSFLSRKGHSIISTTATAFFRQAACRFLLAYKRRDTTQSALQKVLFLIQYAMLNPSDLDVQCLIGAGVRMCIDLTMHQDSNLSVEQSQIRQSLFWAIYYYDRSFCIARSEPYRLPHMVEVDYPDYDSELLYYAQKCHIMQLQSAIFDELYTKTQTSEDVVPRFVTDLEAWSRNNAPLISYNESLSLTLEYHRALILLYRPCKGLKERSFNDSLCLWRSSLHYATFQKTNDETVDVATATEWAYMTGIALIYSFSRILQSRNKDGVSDGIKDIQIGNLWTGLQSISHSLHMISGKWPSAKPIASRFETQAENSIVAVGELIEGRTGVNFPADVTEFDQHGSVTRGLIFGRKKKQAKEEPFEELIQDLLEYQIA